MTETEQEAAPDATIIARFKKIRTRQLLATVPALLAMVMLVMLEDHPDGFFGLPPKVLIAASIGCIIGLLIFSLVNWRCPACKKYLGKGFGPNFCPGCGTRLR